MNKKNNSITLLADSAKSAYNELKKNVITEIQNIQQLQNLSDNDMQLLLGLNENDFSALMDERLYYVIKIDTLIRVNILSEKTGIAIPKPIIGNVIEIYRTENFNNSIQRLLETLGISTADEINFFTDFLIDNINKMKKEEFSNKKNKM